jgi:hypothetical protein
MSKQASNKQSLSDPELEAIIEAERLALERVLEAADLGLREVLEAERLMLESLLTQ